MITLPPFYQLARDGQVALSQVPQSSWAEEDVLLQVSAGSIAGGLVLDLPLTATHIHRNVYFAAVMDDLSAFNIRGRIIATAEGREVFNVPFMHDYPRLTPVVVGTYQSNFLAGWPFSWIRTIAGTYSHPWELGGPIATDHVRWRTAYSTGAPSVTYDYLVAIAPRKFIGVWDKLVIQMDASSATPIIGNGLVHLYLGCKSSNYPT